MPGAPDYLDFDLELSPATDGAYTARVLDSPKGEASATVRMPSSGADLENVILKLGRTRSGVRALGSPQQQLAQSFGTSLYDAVFAGEVGTCFRRSLDQAESEHKGLRIKLRLTDAPALGDVPWEYLYATGLGRFVVLSGQTPLVRYLDLPREVPPLTVAPPLRILLAVCSPTNLAKLDTAAEVAKVTDALADLIDRGLVIVDPLPNATLSALRSALRRNDYHILHFIGHGGFDPVAGDGVLAFEDPSHLGHLVSGGNLGTLLHDFTTLRLAVLNACEGARQSPTDPFSGVAQALVRQGLPAVVAMQFEITDEAATHFSQDFYSSLADGYPIDAALAQARLGVFSSDNDVEWGTPVLYLRARDGRIFHVPPGAATAAATSRAMSRTAERETQQASPATKSGMTPAVESAAGPAVESAPARPGEPTPAAGGTAVATPAPQPEGDTAPAADAAPTAAMPTAPTPAAPPPPPVPAAPPARPEPASSPPQPSAAPQPPYPGPTQPAGYPQPAAYPQPTAYPQPGQPSGYPQPAPPSYPVAPPPRSRAPLVVAAAVLLVGAVGVGWALNRPTGTTPTPTGAPTAGPTGGPTGGKTGAPPPLPAATFVAARGTATIDGAVGEWGAAKAYAASAKVYADATYPAGTAVSATFRLMWDDDALYVLADVADPTLTPADQADPIKRFQGDSVSFELGSDPRALDKASGGLRQSDGHYILGLLSAPGETKAVVNRPIADVSKGFSVGAIEPGTSAWVAQIAGGYRVEARIPWSVTRMTDAMSAGRVLGFNLDISDRIPGTAKYAMFSSNAERVISKQNLPGNWQTIQLG